MHKKIFTSQFQARFWQKVNKTDYCWEWQGAKINGYGYMWVIRNKLSYYSPRISYALTYGEFNQALCVCHKCDNPPCVNPAHLFLGTRAENNYDKKKKGRQQSHVGVKNPNAKLTVLDVENIRKMLSAGTTQTAIAKTFNVSQVHISRISKGRRWTN